MNIDPFSMRFFFCATVGFLLSGTEQLDTEKIKKNQNANFVSSIDVYIMSPLSVICWTIIYFLVELFVLFFLFPRMFIVRYVGYYFLSFNFLYSEVVSKNNN